DVADDGGIEGHGVLLGSGAGVGGGEGLARTGRGRPATNGRPTQESRVNPAGTNSLVLRGVLSSARFTGLASVGRPFMAGRPRAAHAPPPGLKPPALPPGTTASAPPAAPACGR